MEKVPLSIFTTARLTETISNGGSLTLTFPKGRAIAPSNVVKVEIDLKDGAQNDAEIVKDFFTWDYMVKDDYDEINTEVLNGKGSSAIVDYVTYHHAVVANVDVILLNGNGKGRDGKGKGDGICTSANVYGEIVAHYDNNFSTILFDKKQNELVNVEYGNCVELCRHVVVVPALSLLKVDANLYYGATRTIVGEVTFHTFQYGAKLRIIGQNSFINVQVQWSHMQPLLGRRVEGACCEKSIQEFIPDQKPSSAMSIKRNMLSDFTKLYGIYLIEVFSVSIAGRSDEDIDIWGSIKFYFSDYHQHIFLFNKDKTSPQRVLPYQVVPMASYTERLAEFAVLLDLRDVNGRVISKGDICWQEHQFERFISLLDRQMCSVVQGVDGYYAAVHYSIFCAGIQAMVKIYLKGKNSTLKRIKVDGSICSQYSNYDYSTLYKKEYYRMKLFARNSNEPWLQYLDSRTMLSESSVMVPKGSALLIDVNLKVYLPTETTLSDDGSISVGVLQVGDSFRELLEFKIDDMGCLWEPPEIVQKEIERSSQQIAVHVEWKQVPL